MRRHIFLLMIVAVLSAPALSQTVAGNVPVNKDSREVFATLAKWSDAVRDRDTAALGRLFADEFIITTYEGNVRGKAEELEALKPNPNRRTVSIVNEDVKVTIYGQTAVVTALMKIHSVADKRDTHSAFRFTAVMVNKEGIWQIVAVQSTRPSSPAAKPV